MVILNLDVVPLVVVVVGWLVLRRTLVLLPGTSTSFQLPVVLTLCRLWIAGNVNDKSGPVFQPRACLVLVEANLS